MNKEDRFIKLLRADVPPVKLGNENITGNTEKKTKVACQIMKVHCFFEQSGTFKNAFKKYGIEAYDYDIQNDFGETDCIIDLFREIEKSYKDEPSLFDEIKTDDLIFAFFPCTRFEARIPLSFRGESPQQKNWTYTQKLEYSMKLHNELHTLYMYLSKLCVIAYRMGFKLIIENPYTQPHYLTTYWCLKPSLIDKDRTLNGDYYKKPTQYWFINCKPKTNFLFEPLEYVEQKIIAKVKGTDKTTRQTERSLMHPQYADRFIRQYILDEQVWK